MVTVPICSWHPFPTRHPDEMNRLRHLAKHFGDPDTAPEACARRNACVIAEQGKSPHFALEVTSCSTGHMDVQDKPAGYGALGIPAYWRFDETGESHGTRLAGDRLSGIATSPSRSWSFPTTAWRSTARRRT